MRVEPVETPERFYTRAIRWRGNLIPLLFASPAWLLLLFSRELPWLIGAATGFAVLLRVGMNRFGLQRNAWLRARLTKEGQRFVGIETDSLRDPIEPHYDVGALRLDGRALKFEGDRVCIEIPRADVKEVRFRSNPHTWVGLGIFVEVVTPTGSLRLEEREANTLAGNFARRWAFKKWLEASTTGNLAQKP
jgi:hypothetical protein